MFYELLIVFGLFLWLSVVVVYARSAISSLFHPATYYLVVHGIVFAVRPALAYVFEYNELYYAYQFSPSYWEKCQALLVANLGFITFMYVVTKVGNVPMQFRRESMDSMPGVDVLIAFGVSCLLCVPLGVYSTALNIQSKSLNASTMFLDPSTGYSVNTTANGYFNDASLMLLPALVVFAWLLRFRLWACLPFLIAVFGRAATGSRWPFVMAFLSFCLLFLYEKRGIWINRMLVLGLIPFAVLFTMVGLDRGYAIRQIIGLEQVERDSSTAQRFLESMDYGNLEFLEYLVVTIPEKTGTFNYFLGNLQILTEPIPRVIWAEKPIGAPIKLYSLFDYGYPIGMTYSVPGEGWAQLGWLGVIIWCAFFAFIYGRIYVAFAGGRQTLFRVAAYAIFMPLAIAAFRDGFLLTVIKTSAASLMPVIIWWVVWRLMRAKG